MLLFRLLSRLLTLLLLLAAGAPALSAMTEPQSRKPTGTKSADVPETVKKKEIKDVPAPAPLEPVPTPAQLKWQRRELAMFLHFGPNTFTGREWGDGTEDPAIFAPTDFNPRQWAQVAKETGFELLILTAKHHDGFCLWPSQQTDHSVEKTPWQDGKGDVVRDFVNAARAEKLDVGLYLSPWDRNAPVYGDSDKYNAMYVAQLEELLGGRYGPIVEVWFDGANGEGPNDKRQEYDWPRFIENVRRFQPDAVIFSDAGPDVRWVGNERGVAGDPSWSTVDPMIVREPGQGGERVIKHLQHGLKGGTVWRPAETDVSIRPGWFWRESENDKVRTPENLVELYFSSVGRNSLLLLNVPPDTRGQLHEADVAALRDFRARIDEIFETNLARGAIAAANNVRGRDTYPEDKPLWYRFEAIWAIDGNDLSYWATDDEETFGELELDLREPKTFNVISIAEPIALGQRVAKFRVEVENDGQWQPVLSGETIGYKRLARIPETQAQKVRLVIEDALACPLISEFGLYFDPAAPEPSAAGEAETSSE
jgi:alpha-L-fucosidase